MKPVLMILASLVLLALVFLSGVVITAKVIAEPEPHRFAHMDTPDLWTSQPKEVDPAKQTYERLPAAKPADTMETAATNSAVSSPSETVAVIPNGSRTAPSEGEVDAMKTASINPQTASRPNGNTVVGYQPATAPNPQQTAVGAASTVSADQAQACFARYRSYRVEDNTYQPFNGGPRRQCQISGQVSGEQRAGDGTQAARRAGQNVAAVSQQPSRQSARQPDRMIPEEPVYGEDVSYEVQGGYPVQEAASNGAQVGSHEDWCFARYRSYRVEDNSYQPFEGGPRRACQSPNG